MELSAFLSWGGWGYPTAVCGGGAWVLIGSVLASPSLAPGLPLHPDHFHLHEIKQRVFKSTNATPPPHSMSFGGALPGRAVAVHTAHLRLLCLWRFVMLWHTIFRMSLWPSRHFLFWGDENICGDRTFILCAGWKLELLQQKGQIGILQMGILIQPPTHPRIWWGQVGTHCARSAW